MKKIILSFFIALFMLGSIPAVSFASTEQQIPVGVLAQLLAAIQSVVEKVTELQKSSENSVSPVAPITNNKTNISAPLTSSVQINNEGDEMQATCCGCIDWEFPGGEIAATGSCSSLRCKSPYIKEVLAKSFCGAQPGISYSLVGGTKTQESKTTSTPTSTQSFVTISKDASAPISKITLANQQGVELHKIRFAATGSDTTLKKLTLQLVRASKRLWTLNEVTANFSAFYLYDGSTLVGQGIINSSTGNVVFSGINVSLPKDTLKTLTVQADVTPSGTMKDNSTLAFQVYSTNPNDLEIYDANGLLNPKSINLIGGALSNFNLYKSVAPAITNVLNNSTKVGSVNDVISKFSVANAAPIGGRTLSLSNLNIQAILGGSYSPQSTVRNFKLYDENDTLIATAGTSRVLTGTTPSVLIKFIPQPEMIAEIAAGSSKTYTVKADTTNIRNFVPFGSTVLLTTKILGTKGYNSTDFVGPEYYWNTGNTGYEYTPGGTATKIKGNTASDSYQIDGATLTY